MQASLEERVKAMQVRLTQLQTFQTGATTARDLAQDAFDLADCRLDGIYTPEEACAQLRYDLDVSQLRLEVSTLRTDGKAVDLACLKTLLKKNSKQDLEASASEEDDGVSVALILVIAVATLLMIMVIAGAYSYVSSAGKKDEFKQLERKTSLAFENPAYEGAAYDHDATYQEGGEDTRYNFDDDSALASTSPGQHDQGATTELYDEPQLMFSGETNNNANGYLDVRPAADEELEGTVQCTVQQSPPWMYLI